MMLQLHFEYQIFMPWDCTIYSVGIFKDFLEVESVKKELPGGLLYAEYINP